MSGSLSDEASDFIDDAQFLSVGDAVDTSTGSESQRIDGNKVGVAGDCMESLKCVIDNRCRLLMYGGELVREKLLLGSLDDLEGEVGLDSARARLLVPLLKDLGGLKDLETFQLPNEL